MDPTVWGPILWRTFHVIALGYPDVPTELDKLNYKTFYKSFGNVIPCSICASNFRRHFEKVAIDDYLDKPEHLFAWTVIQHNLVNEEKSKPILSVEQAYNIYTNMSENTPVNTPRVPMMNPMTMPLETSPHVTTLNTAGSCDKPLIMTSPHGYGKNAMTTIKNIIAHISMLLTLSIIYKFITMKSKV